MVTEATIEMGDHFYRQFAFFDEFYREFNHEWHLNLDWYDGQV